MKNSLKKKGIKKAAIVEKQPHMVAFNDLEKQVFNPDGKHLGEIEDIILDLTNQKISFGILTFGGIFGIGEKRYAIPWYMLEYKEKGEKFILDIDKEKLELAEAYNAGKYPYPYYGPWATGLYGFWGRPYW